MGFDPQTEARLRELFGGRRCCRCGRPAARLAHDHFYCERHFHAGQRGASSKAGPTATGGSPPDPSTRAAEAPAVEA
jgi:hypothetical protein